MVDDDATVRHEGVLSGLVVQDLHYLAMELAVVEGPDSGLVTRLGPGRTRVGSAEGCGVRLTDRTVSRVHCELELERGGVRVVDPGSTNGTFVDGVRVRDADLRPGSLLRIGATSLRLTGTDEPLVVPLSRKDSFGELLGKSAAMRRTYAVLERAAASPVTVLVQGETGTGKELVARALHRGSPRASGPFVAIDCGAIAENLVESELFGHARGAFSGAVADADSSKRPTAARCSSTRSASSRRSCNPSCCGSSRRGRCDGSAPTWPAGSTCGSSPRRIDRWRRP